MAYGLQVFDSLGNVTLDTYHGITRIVSIVYTGTTGGSVYVQEWESAKAWWVVIDSMASINFWNSSIGCPEVYQSGAYLVWGWHQPPSDYPTTPRAVHVIIGAY